MFKAASQYGCRALIMAIQEPQPKYNTDNIVY